MSDDSNIPGSNDGVLLVDKPSGPTSHDVVARVRRAVRERRIGHTGTLDPMASGLLPLVIGQATRLVPLLIGSDKTYDATIRLGHNTDTDDALGEPTGTPTLVLPSDDAIEAGLSQFRGTFAQRPPAHSAKRIGGTRAYTLARQDKAVDLAAVAVTVRSLQWRGRQGDEVLVTVTATAGFYVRSLARDLGERLGCGAHLSALRRTASGSFLVAQARPLAEVEAAGPAALGWRISPADALPGLPAVTVNAAGLRRVLHGNWLGPEHLAGAPVSGATTIESVRILGPDGRLLALARQAGGTLHPSAVLG